MVRIRLHRGGAKKRPHYRIVAVDGRRPRETRVLEFLGTYDPIPDGSVSLRDSAYDKWVARGAQVSGTVRALVKKRRAAGAEAESPAPQ